MDRALAPLGAVVALIVVVGCSSSSFTTATDAGSDDATRGSTDAARGDAADGANPDANPAYGPYASAGPADVATEMLTVPDGPNASFTLTAYVPSTAGPRPVVLLSSGFFQKTTAYAPYAERLASWGILTLLRDDPGLNESTPDVVADASYVVATWLAAENAASKGKLAGRVDLTRIGLAGHSRGGQIALLSAEGGARGKIKGVFGLDPVDTSMDASPEARTSIATLDVPVAFVGETTDGTGGVGGMPCAPAADNYLVLYKDATSPAVALTAIGADHTMFEDPASCSLCFACTAGTADKASVLAYSVRYLTAFFARELLGDATVGASFEGAGSGLDVKSGRVQLASK